MKKIRIFLLVLLAAVVLTACNDDEQATAVERIQAVETVEAERGDLIVEKSLYGRVTPVHVAPVMLELPGKIDSLNVANGDSVKKDEVLATVMTPAGPQDIKVDQAGEVMQLTAKKGDLVSGEDPLALIVDLADLQVDFTVTDRVLRLLTADMTVTATVDGKDFELTVTSIGKMPDQTGLYPIAGELTNDKDHILPGMVARITIPEERMTDHLILPTEAIVEDNDGTFIYLVKDERVIKTPIDVIATQSDQTAIEAEISVGDEIVVNGQITLSDGAKVTVVKAGETS